MNTFIAVVQGEARYKLKQKRRQEHPDFGASQLCYIGGAGRGSEEAGIHLLVMRLENAEGLKLAGGQRQARRGLGQQAADCILLSSEAVALQLLTGTSRLCHVAIIRASGVFQPLTGHPRGQWGWLSMTAYPGTEFSGAVTFGNSGCWPVECKSRGMFVTPH